MTDLSDITAVATLPPRRPDRPAGRVILLGAGPGDPELLTLKGARVLGEADVVVYDHLANDALLSHCRRDCQFIYAGKIKGHHSLPQEEISHLLVRLAVSGKVVVRLKGGDPYVFGRGGEEVSELREAGIDCEVIPGITAATGCGAATQIPLTDRRHAQAVTFMTAHQRNGELAVNWDILTQAGHTTVVYMGLSKLDEIVAGMLARNMDASHPVAVVAEGTTVRQRTVTGCLADIAGKVTEAALPSPALLIIGDVVREARQLADVDAEHCLLSVIQHSA